VYDPHIARIIKNTLVCAVQRLHQDTALSAMLEVPLLIVSKSTVKSTSLDFSDLATVERCVERFETQYVIFDFGLDMF
jgi:hypothetical protein